MGSFSASSLAKLETCHPDLQRLFHRVVIGFDCTVLEGKRDIEQQRINVAKGVSKTMASKHVFPVEGPALAADVAPYPLKWPDGGLRKMALAGDATAMGEYLKQVALWYAFGGYVMGIAAGMGIPIRWGADWDGDWVIIDQTFDDLPHFELALPLALTPTPA